MGFARKTREALAGGYDPWTHSQAGWEGAARRRSALQFLQVCVCMQHVCACVCSTCACVCGEAWGASERPLSAWRLAPSTPPHAPVHPPCRRECSAPVACLHTRPPPVPPPQPPAQDLRLLTAAHASVAARLEAEAAALDGALAEVEEEGAQGVGGVSAPGELPTTHWWYQQQQQQEQQHHHHHAAARVQVQ